MQAISLDIICAYAQMKSAPKGRLIIIAARRSLNYHLFIIRYSIFINKGGYLLSLRRLHSLCNPKISERP